MRVLQVIPELEAGGAERTTIEIAEALTAAGGAAPVASRGGRMVAELEAAGGSWIEMPVHSKNPFVAYANVKRLTDAMAAHEAQIIHARSRAPAWSALLAARRAKKPFITTYHGTYKARSALKRFYNSVMARGDIVIANSGFIRDYILSQHEIAPERVRVVPRGVDISRFDAANVEPGRISAFREACGLPPYDRRPLILLPARLTRWKGQVEAIRALAALDSQAVLALAGDAQGREAYVGELKTLAAETGVAGRVVFAGHVHDMPAAYGAADLVITPSIEPEAFGRTAAEAQAMGRRVIAADHGGAREVVIPGETGWLSPPGDIDALAKTMEAALSLPESRAFAMGEAASARIRAEYSTQALQRATLNLYQELLKSDHDR